MQILNPFRNAPHTRCRCKTKAGEITSVQSNTPVLDIPDDTSEALIEAITVGKSDGEAMSSRAWHPERGIMDVNDFIAMKKLEKEKKDLEKKQEKERKKKEKEARERAKQPKQSEPRTSNDYKS